MSDVSSYWNISGQNQSEITEDWGIDTGSFPSGFGVSLNLQKKIFHHQPFKLIHIRKGFGVNFFIQNTIMHDTTSEGAIWLADLSANWCVSELFRSYPGNTSECWHRKIRRSDLSVDAQESGFVIGLTYLNSPGLSIRKVNHLDHEIYVLRYTLEPQSAPYGAMNIIMYTASDESILDGMIIRRNAIYQYTSNEIYEFASALIIGE